MKLTMLISCILSSCLLFSSCAGSSSENTSAANSSLSESKVHTHDYTPATCDTPAVCECGATFGEALGHMYVDRFCTECTAVLEGRETIGNLMVLGDSISTFEGCCYYENHWWYQDGGREDKMTDVTNVRQTYWSILLSNTRGKLVALQSSSGSTVCNVGSGGKDKTGDSFTTRFNAMVADGFFEKNTVDTLIIYGGTNDSNMGSPIGEEKYSGWTDSDLDSFKPAFCYLLSRVKEVLPETRVIVIIDTTLKYEVVDGLKAISEHYSVETVELDSSIDMIRPHPTVLGMKQIEREIRETIFK